jgi:2-iminobutanoate/2-iminopropanoate deaminase
MIQRYTTDGGNPYGLPIAAAVRAGDFVFVSGQAALRPDGSIVEGGIAEETRVTIERLKAALASAGCELKDVVKATAWIVDRADLPAFNAVFAEYFGAHPPARSTIMSPLIIDARVEIELTAYKPLQAA